MNDIECTLTVSPIRSFTTRAAQHHPSTRTLRISDHDGANEESPKGDTAATHTITKSIAKLEELVKQITELAEEPQPIKTKRRPSESIAARGWQYLKDQGWSANDQQPDDTRAARRVMFDVGRNAARQDDGHEHSPSKAPATLPEISLVNATEEQPLPRASGHPDAKAHVQKAWLKNNPIPPPRRAAPLEPTDPCPADELSRPDLSPSEEPKPGTHFPFTQMFGVRQNSTSFHYRRSETSDGHTVNLKKVNHVDLWNKPASFDVHSSCAHASVARDWPLGRKRFAATVACLNSACIGLIIGIYAGEVPAIQYVIADFNHYAILGNVFLYSGLAVSTLLLWPLPLLHGRKIYTVAGLALAFGLQIPQGIVVLEYRQPDEV
jgi:hypothetical protein